MPRNDFTSYDATESWLTSAARAAGSSATLTGYGPVRRMVVVVNATATSGTPTNWTFNVEDSPDGGSTWAVIDNFGGAKTATGVYVARIAVPFTDTVRLTWSFTGGTAPTVTFSASAWLEYSQS